MPRKLTAEMLYFNHRKVAPCREGMENFERLFGNEVEVTEELCRQHAELFKPWGAIAYTQLPREMYIDWERQWNRYGEHPKDQWMQYTSDGAAAFAQMFNDLEKRWNTSDSTINARRLYL